MFLYVFFYDVNQVEYKGVSDMLEMVFNIGLRLGYGWFGIYLFIFKYCICVWKYKFQSKKLFINYVKKGSNERI